MLCSHVPIGEVAVFVTHVLSGRSALAWCVLSEIVKAQLRQGLI